MGREKKGEGVVAISFLISLFPRSSPLPRLDYTLLDSYRPYFRRKIVLHALPSITRDNTEGNTHRHGIVITVSFFQNSFTCLASAFCSFFFSFPPFLPRVFFVSSIFSCASPFLYDSTTIIVLRFYSILHDTKEPNLGVSTHGVSTKNTEVRRDVGVRQRCAKVT